MSNLGVLFYLQIIISIILFCNPLSAQRSADNSKVYSNGGRVLNFVVKSKNLKDAREHAIDLISELNWENGFFRRDIGYKIIKT